MNKISKKILAIVTMVAFVVTMMPFAAFAATCNVDPDQSTVQTVSKNAKVYVNEDREQIKVAINNNAGSAVTANQDVYVWLEDEEGNVTRNVTFYNQETGGNNYNDFNKVVAMNNGYVLKLAKDTDAVSTKAIYAQVSKAGTYTVHAGVNFNGVEVTSVSQLLEFGIEDGYSTITARDRASYVNAITVVDNEDSPAEAGTGTITYTAAANGIDSQDVTFDVTSEYEEDSPATTPEGKTITVENNNDGRGLHVLDTETGDATSEITVDDNEQATFTLKADKGIDVGTYKIFLSVDDVDFVLNVVITNEDYGVPETIETVDVDNSYVDVNASDFNEALEAAAQFTVKNANGDVIDSTDFTTTEPALTTGGNHAKYVEVIDQPEDADYDADDFVLADTSDEDNDNMALQLAAGGKLVAGEYTVRVSLLSGEHADVTFTVAKFGDVEEVQIVTAKDTVSFASGSVDYKVVAVDEKGMQKTLTVDNDYSIGVTAATGLDVTVNNAAENATDYRNAVNVTTKPGYLKDDVVGTQIVITAVSEKYSTIVSKELTVVDGEVTATLDFASDNGAAGEVNDVDFSIVDENGDVVAVNGNIYAYVADQGDADANVELDVVSDGDKTKNGKGTISIYADRETTVDVVVAVKDGDTMYASTLNYTVGAAEDPEADTIVAMTIGSSDIIVNNDIVSGDAAPFVDSNWRTMVPVRALSEAFGGTADWDGDARTVTVVNGDTTIVFDADSNKYTVNGEEKEMDTNLTIVDGRTYVPVRFVADELGYQITVLKDAQGLTAGVVFQK